MDCKGIMETGISPQLTAFERNWSDKPLRVPNTAPLLHSQIGYYILRLAGTSQHCSVIAFSDWLFHSEIGWDLPNTVLTSRNGNYSCVNWCLETNEKKDEQTQHVPIRQVFMHPLNTEVCAYYYQTSCTVQSKLGRHRASIISNILLSGWQHVILNGVCDVCLRWTTHSASNQTSASRTR